MERVSLNLLSYFSYYPDFISLSKSKECYFHGSRVQGLQPENKALKDNLSLASTLRENPRKQDTIVHDKKAIRLS